MDQKQDSALPYIHQKNKIQMNNQDTIQLQQTQKKQQQPQYSTNSQKTKKKENVIAPYIYGNNLFKHSGNNTIISGGFRYQIPSFQQAVKQTSKKNDTNNFANTSQSENEDEDKVNATFHHPFRNVTAFEGAALPQNILDQIVQPQKLNTIGNNNSTVANPQITKTRASISLYSDPARNAPAFTDSEANNQASSNKYGRKKYTVQRKIREDNQILYEKPPKQLDKQRVGLEHNGVKIEPSDIFYETNCKNNNKHIINHYSDKLDTLNVNKDKNQQNTGITQRNNWSQSECENMNGIKDKQYLTQYSNTMDQNQMIGQNINNEEQHKNNFNNGIPPFLRNSYQSVNSINNQISSKFPKSTQSTNAKIIDHQKLKTSNDNSAITQITQNFDSPNHKDALVNFQKKQQIKINDVDKQNDKQQLQNNIFNQVGQSHQDFTKFEFTQNDEGKELSSVPSLPKYDKNNVEINNRNTSHINNKNELNTISTQIHHNQQKRHERSHSHRLQNLDQKEGQLMNTLTNNKKPSALSVDQRNQIISNSKIIINNPIKDQNKQDKDIQNVNINVDLNEKQQKNEKSDNNIKRKQIQSNTNKNQLTINVIQGQQNDFNKAQQRKNQIYSFQENKVSQVNIDNEHFIKQKQNKSQINGEQKIESKSDNENNSSLDNVSNPSTQQNENLVNYLNETNTNIQLKESQILNERKNGQISQEPYQRSRISEKSISQMSQHKPQINFVNESFLFDKHANENKMEKRKQSKSLSPELSNKNDYSGKNDLSLKSKLAKACIRFTVLGGGETIEAEDFSLKGIDVNSVANKFRINIKNILEIEDYLEQICLHLQNQSIDYIHSAKRFIQIINEDPQYNINQAHRLFSDEKLCRVGKVLTVLELISVHLIIRIGRIKSSSIRSYYTKMKNLFLYIHQSFLLFWDQIYQLLSQNIQDKDCLERLRERIEEKRQLKLGNKKSSYLQLKQNYDIICNLIKPMIKEFKDTSSEIAKLFKIFEDQSIFDNFKTIKSIFAGDIEQEEENKLEDKENDQNKVNTSIERQNNIANRKVRNIKPYLPPPDSNTKLYTLVLDLDETLIHFYETRNGGQYQKRPFCDKFLREMNKLYELVIFTAGTEDYANWVLDTLDKNKYISFRLFRQHTNFTNCVYVKDLSKIGRDLSKTLIVDNVPENFKLQRENGIGIKSWYNDKNDSALNDLISVLTELVQSNPEDIRLAMKKLRQKYPPHKVRGNFDLPY